MMPTAHEYTFDDIPKQQTVFKMGTVTAVTSGVPTIRFDGEETASQKKYKRLKSYSATVNDRVLLASVSGTYVILGAVI